MNDNTTPGLHKSYSEVLRIARDHATAKEKAYVDVVEDHYVNHVAEEVDTDPISVKAKAVEITQQYVHNGIDWATIRGLEVPAMIHDDEWRKVVAFDAAPALKRDYQNGILGNVLQKLQEINWGGEKEADEIAKTVADLAKPKALQDFFDGVGVPDWQMSGDRNGFEVYIDEESAEAYVREHMPEYAVYFDEPNTSSSRM